MKSKLMILALLALSTLQAAETQKILFIGNSFTFGGEKPIQQFHPELVTDLNKTGIGGVPAIFKMLTQEARLDYDVSLETSGGKGLDFHLAEKADVIAKPWDIVSMHGYSTLDKANPGSAELLVQSASKVAALLHEQNSSVLIYLMATWPRADQIYKQTGHWYGKSVEVMTNELRSGYDQAAAGSPFIRGIIPVGETWLRAFTTGFADRNPYDGIESGKANLWAKDNYHGNSLGSYLEALTLFGAITGHDPRSFGPTESAAAELQISHAQAVAMQKLAFEQLTANGERKLIPFPASK